MAQGMCQRSPALATGSLGTSASSTDWGAPFRHQSFRLPPPFRLPTAPVLVVLDVEHNIPFPYPPIIRVNSPKKLYIVLTSCSFESPSDPLVCHNQVCKKNELNIIRASTFRTGIE